MKNRMQRKKAGKTTQSDAEAFAHLNSDVEDLQEYLDTGEANERLDRAPEGKKGGSWAPHEMHMMKDLRGKLALVIGRMTEMEEKLDDRLRELGYLKR